MRQSMTDRGGSLILQPNSYFANSRLQVANVKYGIKCFLNVLFIVLYANKKL